MIEELLLGLLIGLQGFGFGFLFHDLRVADGYGARLFQVGLLRHDLLDATIHFPPQVLGNV